MSSRPDKPNRPDKSARLRRRGHRSGRKCLYLSGLLADTGARWRHEQDQEQETIRAVTGLEQGCSRERHGDAIGASLVSYGPTADLSERVADLRGLTAVTRFSEPIVTSFGVGEPPEQHDGDNQSDPTIVRMRVSDCRHLQGSTRCHITLM